MKNILVINIVLLGIVELYAQEWELPTTPFYSTSAMLPSGSVLSQKAQTDATTTLISPSMMEEEKLTILQTSAPRRSRPGDWNDPYPNPIGDIPWGMMLVCILIYLHVLHRKSRKIPADKFRNL
jgi:hypothetical protein